MTEVKIERKTIERKTAETNIKLDFEPYGSGKSNIQTGCGFLDHMLTLFAYHGGFNINLNCCGDTHVDYHHTVEDVAICLGSAVSSTLKEKAGINRYGSIILPMDEALILCSIDISGRSHLSFNINIPNEKIGDFDTELVQEFFLGFIRNCNITVHLQQLSGTNSHHIVEGVFKAFSKALSEAMNINPRLNGEIPSTKGVLL